MSDTFYGLECMVRERARAIEREEQRRRMLALVQGRHRRLFLGKRFKRVLAGGMRFRRFLPGRIIRGTEGCGLEACRR